MNSIDLKNITNTKFLYALGHLSKDGNIKNWDNRGWPIMGICKKKEYTDKVECEMRQINGNV